MEFKPFKEAVQRRFSQMTKTGPLFQALIDRNEIWELYLSSFPAGTNPMFRNRTEYDCSACRSFVKNAGGIVQIENGQLTSIWDLELEEGAYQAVADALSRYVKSIGIENVFMFPESQIGTSYNREQLDTKKVITWEHFHIMLPSFLQCPKKDIGPRRSEFQAMHDVMFRSLKEITVDAIETVQDLISQNSLYRGAEKKDLVRAFAALKQEYVGLKNDEARDLFAWSQVIGPNAWVCKIRNDVIGTLLVDLSEGVDLEVAVKSFEDKVSGTNYQRPTALVTPKMKEAAKQKVEELGLMVALDRRYAHLEDISIANVLFADRDSVKRMTGDVFDAVPTKSQNTGKLDKVEEITIDKFVQDVLPTAKSLKVLLEGRHSGNLVSLIAPSDATAESMFKWKNPFSWSYNGDVADSIKEKVKAAGGNVTGDVCCRLAWFNYDDLDLHMIEPDGNRIYFSRKGPSKCGGRLDVDMNAGGGTTRTPVENIFYSMRSRMMNGPYKLLVHQYHRRETNDPGFEVEIDVLGTVYNFPFPTSVRDKVYIEIADLIVSSNGIKVSPIIPAIAQQQEVWSIKTGEFHPVTAMMLSPNYWDGAEIGNKHYFFMLQGCKNPGSARGFYNEFLRSELAPHRHTMELVGSKVRTEESDDQMSGVGFSSTQRNSVICKICGSFERTVKIVF